MAENDGVHSIPARPSAPPVLQDVSEPEYRAELDLPSAPPAAGKKRLLKIRKKTGTKARSGAAAPTLSGKPKSATKNLRWYWKAGAAVLLIGGGVALGTALPDPTKSAEYVALSSEKATLSAELSKLQARYSSLNSSISGRETSISTREAALKTAEASVKTAEADVKKREEAVTAAEKTKAANTIREGTWTVGTDVEPGTYRATSEVTGSCYWEINRSGSNGADIIDNDIVTGGRPAVSLSAGQDFTTSRCGSWLKQ